MNYLNYKSTRNLYVSQLDYNIQAVIKEYLISFYKDDLELNEIEIIKELDLAMNSRISDLEDTINIKKLLQQL